jgi:Cytochrome P460
MIWLAYFLLVIQLSWVVGGADQSVINDHSALPLEIQPQFIHYATINRPDAIRKVYITLAALEAVRRGGSMPTGTKIAMEVYKASQLQSVVSVRQKGDLGQIDAKFTPASLRNGDWHYFEMPLAQPTETVADNPTCHTCHSAAKEQDYVFTMPQLLAFAKTGQVQIVACNRLGRRPCG